MKSQKLPNISDELFNKILRLAKKSNRHRHAHILHKSGAEFNEALNIMQHNSYMHPHLHPSKEKVEQIYIIKGKVCLSLLTDKGSPIQNIGINFLFIQHSSCLRRMEFVSWL